jgi:hypothetical protein
MTCEPIEIMKEKEVDYAKNHLQEQKETSQTSVSATAFSDQD